MGNIADILVGRGAALEPDPLIDAAARKGVARIDPVNVEQIQRAIRTGEQPVPVHEDADPLMVAGEQAGIVRQLPSSPAQVNRVPKSEIFRQLLADFLQNVGAGLAGAGTGPGANLRGAGIAITAGQGREARRQEMNFREQELELQRQNAKSLAAQRESLAKQRGEMAEFDDPVTGQTFRVPLSQLATLIRGAQAGKTAQTTTQQKTESTERITEMKLKAMESLRAAQEELTRLKSSAMKPDSPQFKLKQREVEARIALAQANLGQRRESLELAQARHALALQRLDQPTAPTRTMAEAAPKVLNFVERIRPLVEQEAGGLGPIAGRWSEFMAGKIGAPNAEYTKLRTNIGLLNTLLMRMHVGARGGVQLLEHFRSLIDQGKQSPENLLASLEVIEQYAGDVASMASMLPSGGGGKARMATEAEMREALRKTGNNVQAATKILESQGLKIPQ